MGHRGNKIASLYHHRLYFGKPNWFNFSILLASHDDISFLITEILNEILLMLRKGCDTKLPSSM